ncbi:Zinc finger, GRF-type [Sesbania bispinosa]|nr:Zinc finger, GRF-type [Sesbania bispinosa]
MASFSDRKRTSGVLDLVHRFSRKGEKSVTKCYCGLRAVIRVSGTKKNPGRMFYGCPRLKVDKHTDGEEKLILDEATSTIPTSGTSTSGADGWKKNDMQ